MDLFCFRIASVRAIRNEQENQIFGNKLILLRNLAHPDRVRSEELFETLSDWNAYLKAENIKFPGPRP